jgi:hypothetical protein
MPGCFLKLSCFIGNTMVSPSHIIDVLHILSLYNKSVIDLRIHVSVLTRKKLSICHHIFKRDVDLINLSWKCTTLLSTFDDLFLL